jgi:transposase InsO family protein
LAFKHRYTKPYKPQTNGKIERFWKTIEEELLQGEEFETLEDLKNHILGYVVYYNEHRKHGGIGRQIPVDFITKK